MLLLLLTIYRPPWAVADPNGPDGRLRGAATASGGIYTSSTRTPVYFTGRLEPPIQERPVHAVQPADGRQRDSAPQPSGRYGYSPIAPVTYPALDMPDEAACDRLAAPAPTGCLDCGCEADCPEVFQFLPDGLLYPTYRAGEKEPRMASVWLHESGRGWIWENALGGRIGIVRHGTPVSRQPQGWQLDLEGAVFPRLDWEVHSDLEAADFRVGVPLTWRRGPTAVKFGYYHISSHVGDEFLERNPGFERRNYVRDALLFGVARSLSDDLTVYGEVAVAPSPSGGAEPWEFQFGTEYSPITYCSCRPVPYAAINGHLREEFNFGGSVNIVAGWEWLSDVSDRRLRTGVQYYNGKALQYSFFDKHEELLGMGLWLDF